MQTSSILQWQMLPPFQFCSFGAISCMSENKNKLSFLNFFSQNSTVTIEEFHCKLQEATNFPLRPFVIPFLKVTGSWWGLLMLHAPGRAAWQCHCWETHFKHHGSSVTVHDRLHRLQWCPCGTGVQKVNVITSAVSVRSCVRDKGDLLGSC